MKMKLIVTLFTLALMACNSTEDEILFEYVDPLEKVFPESSYFNTTEAHADVARGEHASFQFAIRSAHTISDLKIEVSDPTAKGISLSEIKKGFVDFVKVGRTNPEPSKDILKAPSGYFPDPILYSNSKDVPFGNTQPIWVSIKIPKDVDPGRYQGKVKITGIINGRNFSRAKTITLQVFKPVIDKTSLWVTNWFFLDRLQYLNNGAHVEKYSDTYWDLTKTMAHTLAEYRQNVAMISPLEHTKYTFDKNEWTFDFTNFNKLVALFIEKGVVGRLEGGHLGTRIDGGWESQFGLKVPIVEKDTTYFETKHFKDADVQNFYNKFLPKLYENIQKKGWDTMYLQHIADEPIDSNVDSYIEISDFIKNIIPEIKIIEACHTAKLKGKIDIWVPQMNFLNEDLDFYKEQQASNDEIWYYTCLAPKGEYANRFIELPLIKTRLLHWVNHKYGITGYLHWGFNYWGSKGGITTSNNPYDDASGMITSSGNVLPGGDCWVVYPGNKTIYPSIRLEAMRDGIVDYELLKMYKEKFPMESKELVGTTVYGFEHYDTNIGDFRKKRRTILKALSE